MRPAGAVAVVDHVEQQVQGVVQVEALPGVLVDQVTYGDEVAEAAEAVALGVFRMVGGQDAQIRAGLRVEEEQDR